MSSMSRIMNLAWLGAVITVGLILLAACGGGEKKTGRATTSPGSEVNVTLKEWTLTPDKTSASAGNVTFVATNAGTVEHELVVIKTDLPPDALKLSGNTVDEEASGKPQGEIHEFQPGKTERLALSLQPGTYVLICNVPTHYQNGVRSAFTVTPPTAASGSY